MRNRLRQSREFMGFAGQVAHEIAQNLRTEDDTKAAKAAREKAEQEMVELARTNPDAFAERYLGDYEKAKTAVEVASMRESVEQEFGTRIGKRVAALPEFQQLTPTDNERILKALNGVPKEDVLAAYTEVAIEVIADKRANALLEKYKAELLPAEAKALAKEQAAKERARQARPGLQAGAATSTDPEPDWKREPDKWDAWYKRRFPGAR